MKAKNAMNKIKCFEMLRNQLWRRDQLKVVNKSIDALRTSKDIIT